MKNHRYTFPNSTDASKSMQRLRLTRYMTVSHTHAKIITGLHVRI